MNAPSDPNRGAQGPDRASGPALEGLSALWQAILDNRRRLLLMVAVWLAIAAAAYLVSRGVWRDDLSRSLIAASALVLFAATTLAIFGAKGPQTLIGVLAAVGAVVAVGGGTITADSLLDDGPPQDGAVVNCPPAPPDGTPNGFVASTDLGYAHIRNEPNLSGGVLLRYPPGCNLEMTAYCIGEPKNHWRFRVPDPVWFYALGDFHSGWIAAADIRAGPGPNSLPREECAGGSPPPGRPEITAPLAKRLSEAVEITAAVPSAIQVGFAVYYEDFPGQPDSATWHQIGVDVNTDDGIGADWDTRSVPGQSRKQAPARVTIAAVPCLGLEFPHYENGRLSVARRGYAAANRGGTPPANPVPPASSMESAGQVACDNQAR